MARTTLSGTAVEESTYVITATFTDSAGSAVVPNTLKWSLSDFNGTLINNRGTVNVGTPGTSNTIVLSGDDLALLTGEATNEIAWRLFTVQATYTSTEGSGLPLNDEYAFKLRPLVRIT